MGISRLQSVALDQHSWRDRASRWCIGPLLSHSGSTSKRWRAPMAASDLGKRWCLFMGLRGLLMLLAGLYAVIWPGQALFFLVTFGAALLVVDGVLGLWALTFGGAKTGNFWFDVIRNVQALITGV